MPLSTIQTAEDSHLSPQNKYVYRAYAPVGWLAKNDNPVTYRELEVGQDGKSIVANVASAFAMGILSKLAATHTHHASNLSTSAAILEHAATLNLKDQPGKGYTSTQSNYEFGDTLPIQNIEKVMTIATDASTAIGFDSDIINTMNSQFKQGAEIVSDTHWDTLKSGAIMPTQLVYITTSEPPEYVLVHGIDNGLIFYSSDEAKKCAESNFPIPVVEKPLSVAQLFQPETPSQQFDLTTTSGVLATFKKLNANVSLAQHTFEMEEMADIDKRKDNASKAKEIEANKNPFVASTPAVEQTDPKKPAIELEEAPPSPKVRR